MSEEATVRAATEARIKRELRERDLIKHGRAVDEDDVVDRHAEAWLEAARPSAAPECREATERMLEGRRAAAREGRHTSGPAPFGYRRDYADAIPGRLSSGVPLVVHEVEAAIVRRIFREYLRLKSVGKVLGLLNEFSRTRSGVKWSRAGIAWILRNETYLGRVHFGKIRATGEHQAIVPPITFNLVQKLMKKNRKNGRST